MTIHDAIHRMEQCIQNVWLAGKRAWFMQGLDVIKQYVGETANEIDKLKAELKQAQESVQVRKGAKRGRQANPDS